ncbi:hypothetical protein SKAU_G00091000 [Synaphobranchus kaupii]|uniref:Uncharacterized protein n=1 Tax=Synaphobranchus kaupii TaxID=118154 RepID=A0A9Q1FWU0_SYNKA|nr:hypothetical protein SKAU_G00091000 [Synaphobranchus kaupii]
MTHFAALLWLGEVTGMETTLQVQYHCKPGGGASGVQESPGVRAAAQSGRAAAASIGYASSEWPVGGPAHPSCKALSAEVDLKDSGGLRFPKSSVPEARLADVNVGRSEREKRAAPLKPDPNGEEHVQRSRKGHMLPALCWRPLAIAASMSGAGCSGFPA